MFAPPFRDPMNYNIHPLIKTGIDVVGGAMHNRFIVEEKGGVVMRSGAGYSPGGMAGFARRSTSTT